MIVITGKNGEGSGMFVSYTIERLLNEKQQACVMLLDDTSEFTPLYDKLKGRQVMVNHPTKSVKEQLANGISSRFIHLRFDEPIEENLSQIKSLEKELSESGYWVFVVFKTTDKEQALLIQNEYDRL